MSCNGADFLCQGFTEFLLQERVEYGWLMKLIVDKIVGNVSVDQVRSESASVILFVLVMSSG